MDNLLASAKRPRILISSTGINDRSNRIAVGADEMLLNAINHMNAKSGAYVFLDQSFEKEVGQLELLSPTEDRKKPKVYFRGAITQVDTNTINDKINVSLDLTNSPHPPTIHGGALKTASPSINRGVSVVSVDLHLVSYPDKTVLPGGSVANSMVVTNKAFGTGGSGLIKLTGYNMSISFNRVESIGQAVRNLVELGVIELLGRHAKVPYWQCLNIQPANEKLENSKRSAFIFTPNTVSIMEAQRMLLKLGYYTGQPNGMMDRKTHAALSKFQADKNLIATGDLNYDVYTRLVQEFNGYPVNGVFRTYPRQINRNTQRHLALSTLKARYRLNDTLIVKLKSKSSGYIYCFHQSGAGDITQILPKKSDTRLQVSPNYARSLPREDDGFVLKFDGDYKTERIMCTLQQISTNSTSPFEGKFKMFGPLPVKRLEDIPPSFARFGGLKDWVMISETASR